MADEQTTTEPMCECGCGATVAACTCPNCDHKAKA